MGDRGCGTGSPVEAFVPLAHVPGGGGAGRTIPVNRKEVGARMSDPVLFAAAVAFFGLVLVVAAIEEFQRRRGR